MVRRWSTMFRLKKCRSHTGRHIFHPTPLSDVFLNRSIQTPDPGINFDSSSVVKSTPNKDDPALGWFKTMIQHDTAVPISWPDYSQGGVRLMFFLAKIFIGIFSMGRRFSWVCRPIALRNCNISHWIIT
jgi:hypothetical protein